MRPRIPKQQIDLLKAVPLFSGCSQSELRAVAQLGTPVSVDKGRSSTAQGSAGREFFLVLSAWRRAGSGSARSRSSRPAATSARSCTGIRTADVVAETDMELLVF